MNYSKVGLFIKPQSDADSEILLAAFNSKGMFPAKENDGIFLGDTAQPIAMHKARVTEIVRQTGVIANIHEAKPEKETSLREWND